MLDHGGVTPFVGAAHVAGHALAAVQHLQRCEVDPISRTLSN